MTALHNIQLLTAKNTTKFVGGCGADAIAAEIGSMAASRDFRMVV